MFVLIWATLLFSLRGNSADTGASVRQRQHCPNPGYCITLTEGEITAEAGLCVVIPCSFTTGYYFTPQHIVWYKCEQFTCSDSDIIFHTYTNNRKVQPEFRGRVSLLETDLSQKTCSIIINDLTESDSGSYQLRVNGMWLGKMDGFTFPQKATISVKALSQKPTVMVPPLTEGQQITLTCTAPGLCSGSVPTITWTWRGRGEKTAEITGNLTERKTENITAVTQRHSSTLTFNASAEHHGTQVTCKVGFTGDTATEETLTLNVTLSPVQHYRPGSAVLPWVLGVSLSVNVFSIIYVIFLCLLLEGRNCPVECLNHQIRMFVLIWVTLFLPVSGSSTDTGASVRQRQHCPIQGYCITLTEGEITAEAGLCVVIPCSFTTDYSFTPQHIVWYKCEQYSCSDSDIIFHTYTNNRKVQPEFRGRVSPLETDLSQKTCSIVINDLTESDSGSYQLRVIGMWLGRTDRFTFPQKATISVKALSQKPTVMVPPLTEGQQTTLTCTAPGLCSGSVPTITWTWRGRGEDDSHITGNIVTETLIAFKQRHSSTLTFNASAEHHGTQVTCKVGFTGDTATEETVTLNVTYVKEIKVTGNTSLKEGETLNLTCSIESFPPSSIMWTKLSNKTVKNGRETNLQNGTETDLQTDTETASLIINNVTAEHAGQYICTAKHLNNILTNEDDVTVKYMRKPEITGDVIVKEGDTLNLTCNAESFPPSLITWSKLGLNTSLHSRIDVDLQNNTGLSTLIIPNVTTEHSGCYICTVKHVDNTLTLHADVTVARFVKILKGSGCVAQSTALTCVCISQGVPLPTIKWPMIENHTEYSVITTVSKHTVNSTITLPVTDHRNTAVECVSSNGNGEAKENLTIQIHSPKKEGQSTGLLSIVSRLDIIIAFLIGVLLTTTLCCLAKTYNRKNQKSSGSLDGTLEMVTAQEDPLIHPDQAVQDNQTHHQEAPKDGAEGVERGAPDLDSAAKDVEYASIDFSVLKRRSLRGAAKKQETTETEYTEIKREEKTDCLKYRIMMFVLFWATLLFSLRGSNADEGASVRQKQDCPVPGYCITLTEGEITAEAGLCVVIPCSFTTPDTFTPQHIIWSKCEPSKKCSESYIIFHTYKNNTKVQPQFRGRVSLLETNLSQKTCSIVFNDLTDSDSGSYQLRVIGRTDRLTFPQKATISVKALSQKPTVMVPPLTEGQQITLTCTAPGLCSGSVPTITWTWRGRGENTTEITGNLTERKTENLTAVTQRHSSTLTFNASAEHHGTQVTCKVGFTGDTATEETLTLNVTYVKEIKFTANRSLEEGETLNLTCSVESFPPSSIMWTKLSNKTNGRETNLQNGTETDLQTDTETASLIIPNVTAEQAGQYICTAKHLNNTVTKEVDVTVKYMRKPEITGDVIVKEGGTLNLTCNAESFPQSLITWSKLGLNTSLHSKIDVDLQNDTGLSTLIIPNVTTEHSGRYICTVKHVDNTLTLHADVTVARFAKILKDSGCVAQSTVLTCVCISQGVPLPTIKWPLIENHTGYSVITTVSNHTVNSTITLPVTDHRNTAVECISSNGNGEAKENLTIQKLSPKKEGLLSIVSRLDIIIAFLIGVLLTTTLCCLAKKCHRKKQKSSGSLDGTLEMVTAQEDPLIHPDQAVQDNQTHHQEAPKDGAEGVERGAPDLDGAAKDVEYASIDFSVLKRRSLRGTAKKQETTETEYTEIKREEKVERQDNDGEPDEMLECKEEEAAMAEDDEEIKHCVAKEEEVEDVALYSNVKDIMDEM
ncbi:uncharacterized protein LOC113169033 [Scomber scombrus]|uniref:B-cell receptor CD22 n=1 Tax=Scomber scombrus TaxID=13677 RepID=A0AAV1NYA5_SCOSC